MRIMDQPKFGPMFKFNDANVYWALYVISGGKRIGRKRLANDIGIGEGSMRRIVNMLKEWDFIITKQTGISITKSGLIFLKNIPIRPIDVYIQDSVVGEYQQGALVLGAAGKINNGMEQRDVGIRVGAAGCTTIIIRNESLMIPPDWNLDEKDPCVAQRIRKDTGMTANDVLVIGGGNTRSSAIEATISAALEML